LPTLEQRRNEALASAVEGAAHLPFVLSYFGAKAEPLHVRIVTNDGQQVECRLQEVDLYAQQVVCLDRDDAPMRIPLTNLAAVWHRRPLVWRSVAVWTSAGFLGAVFGSGQHTLGILFGALLGLVGGALLSWLLHDSPTMCRWRQLYGGPPAGESPAA
jgi:hypothetical protein